MGDSPSDGKPVELKSKQEMLSTKWSFDFLTAHENYVKAVRRGEIKPDPITLDYGLDGSNPDGVGFSSLTREVRQWYYGRKKLKQGERPPEYGFTAEQGRMMEIPVMRTLERMGIKFEPQTAAKTPNYGGFTDGLGHYNGDLVLFESKHVNASRYLEMWYNPLNEADVGYFWQAQGELVATGAAYSLFVVTAQDSSSLKAKLTEDKRFHSKSGYWYDHDNEPNPKAFAFKLYPLPNAHEYMDKRAVSMLATVNGEKPPAREYDVNKDWHCRDEFCGYRQQCLEDGKTGDSIYQLPIVKVEQVYLSDK